MRIWISRVTTILFIVSLFAVPQSQMMAQDLPDLPEATPTFTEPDDGGDTPGESESEGEPEGDGGEGSSGEPLQEDVIPVGTPDSDPSSNQSGLTDMGPNALLFGEHAFLEWDWDGDALTGIMAFNPGFVAQAGDTVEVNYSSDSLSLNPGPYTIPGLPVVVTASDDTETITLTFSEGYIPPEPGENEFLHIIDVAFPGEIHFPECRPDADGYTNEAVITVTTLVYFSESFTVVGDECEPADGVVITLVEYEFEIQSVGIEFDIPSTGVTSGTQVTVEYPADVLNVESGPFDVLSWALSGEPVVIGSAVASDGVITITFQDFVPETEGDDISVAIWIGATISTDVCDPEQDEYLEDHGRIYFVAKPGGTFVSDLPSSEDREFNNYILCNAAPASKSGELSADGTEVYWTIDTGDLLNGGEVYDGAFLTPITFDCDSINVVPVSNVEDYEISCNPEFPVEFFVDLHGEGPVRAIITVTTFVDQEFVEIGNQNCVQLRANGVPDDLFSITSYDVGLGGMVCAQVFSEGQGDFISNVASADTLHQGDELTYTVSFTTTSSVWIQLSLESVLPAEGFEVTGITCTFEPTEFAPDECAVQDDNTISVGMNRLVGDGVLDGGGEITLEITGVVTAEPGTQLMSEACGERALNIPGFPPVFDMFGSDVICETATTQVLQADDGNGDNGNGDNGNGDNGDNDTGDNGNGDNGTGDNGNGDNGTGDNGTGDNGNGDKGTGDNGNGDNGSGEDATPQPGPGADSDAGAVTGLPETGNRGPSPVSTIFVAAIAVGLLLTAGIGIQLRPRDD